MFAETELSDVKYPAGKALVSFVKLVPSLGSAMHNGLYPAIRPLFF